MAVQTAAYLHDANNQPITLGGILSSSAKTLSANNTTAHVPIFTVTGQIEFTALFGVITTDIGVNNTAAFWRTNDGTNQNAITLATGTILSAAVDGGVISKKAGVGTALTLTAGTSGQVMENATSGANYFQDFVIIANPDATTNIEFTYTTTDAPTSGAITFYVRWAPLTPGSSIAPL